LVKTSLCPLFLKGRCLAQGGLCPFAHGHKELRRTSAFEDPPKRKTKVHVQHETTEDTIQTLLSEASNSSCPKVNTDNNVKFELLLPPYTVVSEAGGDWKDLETLLINAAPDFYED